MTRFNIHEKNNVKKKNLYGWKIGSSKKIMKDNNNKKKKFRRGK